MMPLEPGSGLAATTPADLAIVIVSYNVRDLLRRCLISVLNAANQLDRKSQVVVVDNASQDGSVDMVRAEFPGIRLIALPANVGFAAGNNAALRTLVAVPTQADDKGFTSLPSDANAKSIIPEPTYILLLNPDTEVAEDALVRMVGYLDHHREAVVVGPGLRYGDGTPQSSRRRFPTVGTLFWESTLLEQWWPHNPWARRYRLEDRPADVVQEVDWVVGAALMVRGVALAQAGLLDEKFFMYSEELEWQMRLRRYGRIVYLPEALVLHYEGKSSEQNLARRHINFNRSKLRYARLRWGRLVAAALRTFLLGTYFVQVSIEAGKWLLGHKRGLRRQRLAQYGRVLRSGL